MHQSNIRLSLAALLAVTAHLSSSSAAPAGGKKLSAEYHYSFPGKTQMPAGSELFGPGAEEVVRFETEGLRFTLPAGWDGERPGTGWVSGITAKGDFEITMTYEMLQEPEPGARKAGTRLTLATVQDTPMSGVATMSRALGTKNQKMFITWSRTRVNEKPNVSSQLYPAETRSGKLRLVRNGSTLYFYALEDGQDDFRLLNKHEFGDGDLQKIEIHAATGGAKDALEARVTDLSIKAEALANLPPAPEPTASAPLPSTERAGSLRWLLAIVVVLALISIAIALWRLAPLKKRAPAGEKGDAARFSNLRRST
jgi:hypothetical protein